MTRQAVRDVDRIAIEDYGMPGMILMENAGRGAARTILDMLVDRESPRMAVICGAGNNGGDGFVIARHLYNEHVDVTLYLAVNGDRLKGDARVNYEIARRMKPPILPLVSQSDLDDAAGPLSDCDVIVDALLGTGFSGQVRSPFDAIIDQVNGLAGAKTNSLAGAKTNGLAGAKVVAVDVPSGLDCDTGRPSNATIRADVTVTFVAPKVGFAGPQAADYVGRVVTVDIGVPRDIVPDR